MKMRKLLRRVFLVTSILLPVVFSSCAWEAQYDYSNIQEKSTYNTFANDLDPIVIRTPLNLKFGKKGSDKTIIETDGSVVIFYDWKQKSVHDYFYMPGRNDKEEILPVVKTSDGKRKIYAVERFSQKLYVFSPEADKPELLDFDEKNNNFIDWGYWQRPVSPNNRYAIRFLQNYGSNDHPSVGVKIIDSNDNSVVKSFDIDNTTCLDYTTPYQDSNGIYWFMYHKVSEDGTATLYYVGKIDPSTQSFSENEISWTSNDNYYASYDFLGVDDTYLYVYKEHEASNTDSSDKTVEVLIIKKSDYSVAPVSILDLEKRGTTKSVVNVNGETYLYTFGTEGKALLFKLSAARDKFEKVASIGLDNIPELVVRGNEIYFVNSLTSEVKITYFNTTTQVMSETQTISIKDDVE